MSDATHEFYEASYGRSGFAAQRRYPNEELLRFIGSNYFHLPREERNRIRVLEVGCGSGANLWMLAHEGFETHGIELSPEGVALAKRMLDEWSVKADVKTADMTALPFSSSCFDGVVDVFSSYCLDETGFARFAAELARVLKRAGRFFSYTPSKASDAFKDPGPSKRIDTSTLDGIHRETSPYHGNLYPFRFASPEDITQTMSQNGLRISSLERIGRTYRNGQEYFEFLSYVACKP